MNHSLVGATPKNESNRKNCYANSEVGIPHHILWVGVGGCQYLISVRGYTTLKLLGKGGGGAVYLARHDRTNELTALKVMLPQVAANQ